MPNLGCHPDVITLKKANSVEVQGWGLAFFGQERLSLFTQQRFLLYKHRDLCTQLNPHVETAHSQKGVFSTQGIQVGFGFFLTEKILFELEVWREN